MAEGERRIETWGPIAQIVTQYSLDGLAIRNAAHSYATQFVASALAWAGTLAKAAGGRLYIADVSRATYGAPFPPHKSHRFGRDVDVGYTLDRYPTPIKIPTSPSFARILCQLRPYVDRVFVSTARKNELQGLASLQKCTLPPLVVWPGHQTHAHIRFVATAANTTEPDDDDGDSTSQDFILPDWDADSGWDGPPDGYPYARAVLDQYMSAPELLQRGPDKNQPSPASLVLAVRTYDWYRALRQPSWPPIGQACGNAPGAYLAPQCQFYGSAARYMHRHETDE